MVRRHGWKATARPTAAGSIGRCSVVSLPRLGRLRDTCWEYPPWTPAEMALAKTESVFDELSPDGANDPLGAGIWPPLDASAPSSAAKGSNDSASRARRPGLAVSLDGTPRAHEVHEGVQLPLESQNFEFTGSGELDVEFAAWGLSVETP